MKRIVFTGALALAFLGGPAAANEFADQLTALASTDISKIVSDPQVIAAIKAQNAETSGYDQANIDALDKQWRAEIDKSNKPLIDKTLGNALSGHLHEIKERGGGLYTEIFVMDAKGLNVGQSDITSDYWQGDEAKWQETFLIGKGATHIGDVELDESTQSYQSQLSVAITDPDSGEVIGAATFGVNIELLP
ncbi:hypothetical protein H2509_02460 [Stappia sp. F7233]|uniref:Uncharacterized protein n=1 Tax=Stappia albiluteola TaxID=2758565 RepID=A0A839A9Y2_9HYPH|nr:hypothetical protein [Stappia albiluteola]MBA5775986.1 hypothetical protein [Stappia albiluteola]